VFRDAEATRIKLLVNVEDGAVTGQQVDQIPVVERSTINTQALIMEGESLLIGGMTRESNSQNVDKVPGPGRRSGRSASAFKNKTSASSRVERMFLITPRLAGSRAAVPAPARATTTTAAAPVAAPAAAAAPAPRPGPRTGPCPCPCPGGARRAGPGRRPGARTRPGPRRARVHRARPRRHAGRPARADPAARPNPPPAVTRVVAPGRIAER
jgi:type III secretion protein C